MKKWKRLFVNGHEYNKTILPAVYLLKSFHCGTDNISQMEKIILKMNGTAVQISGYVLMVSL
jgi:hypothetical protein